MAYNPEMEKLKALQALTQQIAGQYGGGNDVQSVNTQNNAAVEGMRAQGMTDAQIAQALPSLPWNNQSQAISAQMPMVASQEPVSEVAAVAPQTPVEAPMPAPEQAAAPQGQPSFFQRMGQRFDQAATGGIIDPTTLTKDQRRMLRAQLLMNVGGALSQNRPVGEGFQQQYNMLTKRQADEQAKQIEATRKSILSGADISTKEGVMAVLPKLAQAGLQDDLFKFSDYARTAFPDPFGIINTGQGTLIYDKTKNPFNPDGTPNLSIGFMMPGTTPQPEGITPYQAAQIELERERNDIARGKAQAAEAAKKDYNLLTTKDSTILEKNSAQLFQVDTSAASFKPEYAGKTLGGEAIIKAMRVAPESIDNPVLRDAAAWWSSYDRYKNVVRNELFGASLTANEQEAFNKADINPDMSPELIRRNLAQQRETLSVANARKAATLVAGNVNPEQVSIAGAIDFTGRENPGYAPEKWDSWTAKQKQLAQREFWRNRINPKIGTAKPAAGEKYKVGQRITYGGKKYEVIPGGTDTNPNLREVK
jgi:hypothetical protein